MSVGVAIAAVFFNGSLGEGRFVIIQITFK